MPLYAQIILTVLLGVVMVFFTLVLAAGIFDPGEDRGASRWGAVAILVLVDVALAFGVLAVWV